MMGVYEPDEKKHISWKLFSEGQIGYPSGCSDVKGPKDSQLDQNSIDMI